MSGVRQGCVLAPALFCVAIDWILRHMKDKPGIDVGREHFSDLVYADDTAFLVNTTSDAVLSLSSFQDTEDTALALGLQISWPKTKLQYLGAGHQPPSVSVDGNAVDSVDSFVYLGSLLSSDDYCRLDINRRIGLASSVMSALHDIWKYRYLSITTKICIYQALVQSVSLYAAETWTPLVTDIKALEAFHMKYQRQLLQISWQQVIQNDEVAVTTGLPSISEVISNRRSALFGHVARLQQDVPAHKALHCHVDLSLGRPPKDQWKCRPG